jgi:hypothetical protein
MHKIMKQIGIMGGGHKNKRKGRHRNDRQGGRQGGNRNGGLPRGLMDMFGGFN